MEKIKIKNINKDTKRKYYYFIFFNTPKNKTKMQVYNK